MLKKKSTKIIGIILALCVIVGAGIFLYHDYYTLKEADLILFMGQSNMSGSHFIYGTEQYERCRRQRRRSTGTDQGGGV